MRFELSDLPPLSPLSPYIPAGAEHDHQDARGEIPAEGKASLGLGWMMEGPSSSYQESGLPSERIESRAVESLEERIEALAEESQTGITNTELDEVFAVHPDDIIAEVDEYLTADDVTMEEWMNDASFLLEEEMLLEAVRTPTESEEEELLA